MAIFNLYTRYYLASATINWQSLIIDLM